MVRYWDRMGSVVGDVFRLYGIDSTQWVRCLLAETDTEAIQWTDHDGDKQVISLPWSGAPESEWQAFFVLLEMRLKFMPRAA